MVSGGPVIGLYCEPEVSEDDEIDDVGQLNAFFDILESEAESTERYQLPDIDGEDAFIRIGSIAMVRIDLDALESVEEGDA
ncbi:hypothetical protein [Entomohabitans teleogrylli]|uniref:hypothetical protein n=1 Tax=Entomohabitans teleogrylli TaxID=1384589 RepID=UPI000AB09E23|nr:hypothetical protein [Entomohabitans teleogrylli]